MVTVWVATSVYMKDGLELVLYDASNVKAPKSIAATSEHQVVKAGASLFLHLVVARPKAAAGEKATPFPRGKVLGYEVYALNNAIPDNSPLHRVSLTTGLDYGPYPWPTFFLQAERTPLRVLHGSCRRAYAAGRDAMAASDTLIRDTLADVSKRPTLMILTGDQIYADDILWAMWSLTSKLARQVAGYDETAPVDGKLKALSTVDGRKDLVLKNGLTTDDGENHLIGFSEYAAHYLLNWSDTVWDGYEPKFGPGKKSKLDDASGLTEVETFRQTLPAVRRALANIPTYMIFDDHDVTDDWNLDQQWLKETSASPLGTRLITCAMFAYWLFQAWGNDRDTFDSKFVAQVQAFCDLFAQKAGSPTAEDTRAFDTFIRATVHPSIGFGTPPSWSYVIPSAPPIIVLNTRTSRDLQVRGRGAGLIDKDGQLELRRIIEKAQRQGILDLSVMPLVMVSATPVWPVQFIDLLQRGQIMGGSSPQAADLEFWRNNLRAHTDFLAKLMQQFAPSSIVFLSGDVHYGFTAHTALYGGADPLADIDAKRKTGDKLVDIYQLTSSAFKNENSNVALSRHWFSKPVSPLLAGVDIDNDWVNYLFDSQTDVQLNGQSFMNALLRLKDGQNYTVPQVWVMNVASMPRGPLLMPDYLFKNLNLKVIGSARWREEVELFDHRGSSGAYVTSEAHVGLVTFNGRSLTHDLYGLEDPGNAPLARLAPKTWGPARVAMRLGR
jgi:hypothetical protein